MGFHKGKPLAALVVFRACLQWRAFQADRTSMFDRIIKVQNLRMQSLIVPLIKPGVG
jgi:myosin-5